MKLFAVALGAFIGAMVGAGLDIFIDARIEINHPSHTIGIPLVCCVIVGSSLIGGIVVSNLVRRSG